MAHWEGTHDTCRWHDASRAMTTPCGSVPECGQIEYVALPRNSIEGIGTGIVSEHLRDQLSATGHLRQTARQAVLPPEAGVQEGWSVAGQRLESRWRFLL